MRLNEVFDWKKVIETSELINGLKIEIPESRSLNEKEIESLKLLGNIWEKLLLAISRGRLI